MTKIQTESHVVFRAPKVFKREIQRAAKTLDLDMSKLCRIAIKRYITQELAKTSSNVSTLAEAE